VPENPSVVDLDPYYSVAGHRGAVMGFIHANKKVSKEELGKVFGDKRKLAEAMGGLWDRRQIHFVDGNYSIAPESEWVTKWTRDGRARW
jgi:hypothetical protein